MKYGIYKWHKISTLLNKSPQQCKRRWLEFLSPTINKEWKSTDELLDLVKIFGNQWELIGKKLGKPANECYKKYGEIISGFKGYNSVDHTEDNGETDYEHINLIKARILNTKTRKELRKQSINQRKQDIYDLNIRKRNELNLETEIDAEDVLRNVKNFNKYEDCKFNENYIKKKKIIEKFDKIIKNEYINKKNIEKN